jgi:hypothetical protein
VLRQEHDHNKTRPDKKRPNKTRPDKTKYVNVNDISNVFNVFNVFNVIDNILNVNINANVNGHSGTVYDDT